MLGKLSEDEQKVKEQAKQLRQKLISIKHKKEIQYQNAIKEELSDIYNLKFQEFKKELQEQYISQLTSLELAKEFRMTEVIDVEARIKESIKKIEDQEKVLRQKDSDLESSFQDAVEFLNKKKADQIEEIRVKLQENNDEKIESYKERIDIE